MLTIQNSAAIFHSSMDRTVSGSKRKKSRPFIPGLEVTLCVIPLRKS